jgi:hypothetical protein
MDTAIPKDAKIGPPAGPFERGREFLLRAEAGTQAIEYLLVMTFAVVPCFSAILLLLDVLREFLGFETVVLTSPFF